MSVSLPSSVRRLFALLAAVALVLGLAAALPAAPAYAAAPSNDNIENSIRVSLESLPLTTATVNRREATVQPGEVLSYYPQSVWWHFTPTTDRYIQLGMGTSTGSHHLVVYDYGSIGTPAWSQLTQLGSGTTVSMKARANRTYYIRASTASSTAVTTDADGVTQLTIRDLVSDVRVESISATPVPGSRVLAAGPGRGHQRPGGERRPAVDDHLPARRLDAAGGRERSDRRRASQRGTGVRQLRHGGSRRA